MMDDHVVEHDAALIPQARPNSLGAAKNVRQATHRPSARGRVSTTRHYYWLTRAIGTAYRTDAPCQAFP